MEETIRQIVREELERALSAVSTRTASPDTGALPLTLSVEQAAEVLGVSRNKCYDLTRRRGFPATRDGNRIMIPRDALLRWLEQEAFANPGGMECVRRGR